MVYNLGSNIASNIAMENAGKLLYLAIVTLSLNQANISAVVTSV